MRLTRALLLIVLVFSGCGGPKRIVKLPVPREDVLHAYRLMAEGDEKFRVRQFHFALLKYSEASRLNPYHEVIFNKLAIAYSRLQQFPQAEKAAERAIGLEPSYSSAHNTIGIVYLANQSNKRAIRSFQEAIRLRPEEPNFYINLGQAYLRDGKYEEGLRTYQKALELDPEILNNADFIELTPQSTEVSVPESLYQMARVFAELGNKRSCLEYLGKALSAGFSDGRRLMSDTAFEKFYEDAEFIDLIALFGIENKNS
jgi:tetratricopeptide (TPR) repeat protein